VVTLEKWSQTRIPTTFKTIVSVVFYL
jgi:hypothetical protein